MSPAEEGDVDRAEDVVHGLHLYLYMYIYNYVCVCVGIYIYILSLSLSLSLSTFFFCGVELTRRAYRVKKNPVIVSAGRKTIKKGGKCVW